MRLLVTGAAGMLGTDLVAAAGRAGHDVLALARTDLDVLDAAAVRAAVGDARPDAVVNCAAYTDVDGAEAEEAAATALNGAAAGHVAAAAHAAGAFTVHVSSDYVFDGRGAEPYVESSPTAPLGAYGRSKLAGEHAVAAAAPGTHAIVRTAWLFGAPRRRTSSRRCCRLAGERDALSVVDDQVGCPTFTGHLAPGADRARRGARGRASTTSPAAAPARGSTSPPRRSPRAGSTSSWPAAAPRTSAGPRRARPTPSCARSGPTRPCSRRGSRDCTPISRRP